MSAAVSDAVAVAVALVAAPDRADVVRASRMPEGVLDVIRVAAGDLAFGEEIAGRLGIARRDLEEACIHFAHSVMFHPEADYFQVLGVSPDADEDLLKQHFRWLLKWLHPDRDPEGWVSAYAERVNIAWNWLRRADRRSAYRSQLASSPPAEPVAISELVAANHQRPEVFPRFRGRMVPSRLISIVPVALVGVIVLVAVGLLAAHRAGQNLLAEEAGRAASHSSSAGRVASAELPTVPETTNDPVAAAESTPGKPLRAAGGSSGVVVDAPPPVDPVIRAGALARETPKMPAPRMAPTRDSGAVELVKVAARGEPRVESAPTPNVAAAVPVHTRGPPSPARPVTRPVSVGGAPLAATTAPSSGATSVADPAGSPHGLVPARDVATQTALASGSIALGESPAIAAEPNRPPVVVPAVQSPAVDSVGADESRAVRDVLGRFSDAYRAGDARSLVVLFRPNAVTPYGNLLDFHDHYGQVVARSSRRSLEFLELTMRPTERGIEAVGRYELALGRTRGGGVEATAGDARVLIEFEDGRPLIAALEL